MQSWFLISCLPVIYCSKKPPHKITNYNYFNKSQNSASQWNRCSCYLAYVNSVEQCSKETYSPGSSNCNKNRACKINSTENNCQRIGNPLFIQFFCHFSPPFNCFI